MTESVEKARSCCKELRAEGRSRWKFDDDEDIDFDNDDDDDDDDFEEESDDVEGGLALSAKVLICTIFSMSS